MTDLEYELAAALRELRDRFAGKLGRNSLANLRKNFRDLRAWNNACDALAKVDVVQKEHEMLKECAP